MKGRLPGVILDVSAGRPFMLVEVGHEGQAARGDP
jgi:hypothetical protein